ncbi:hypothetical protein D9M70_614690 [compost metagenome]
MQGRARHDICSVSMHFILQVSDFCDCHSGLCCAHISRGCSELADWEQCSMVTAGVVGSASAMQSALIGDQPLARRLGVQADLKMHRWNRQFVATVGGVDTLG